MFKRGKFYEYNKVPGAYVIKEEVSGKFYIGSSGNLNKRLIVHHGDLKHKKHHSEQLQHIYDEGMELSYEIHPTDSREEAYKLEQKLLDENKDSSLLLNIATDVKASFRGMSHSEEFKKKISALHKDKIVSDETRAKIGLANVGRIKSEEVRATISAKAKERMSHQEARNKQIDTNPKRQLVSIDGVIYASIRQAAKSNNTSHSSISARIKSKDPLFEDCIKL